MPELAEVETVARHLAVRLPGRRVQAVWRSRLPLRAPVSPAGLRGLVGRTFRGVRRRGKYLLLDLDGAVVLAHLGMSGRLIVEDEPRRPPHTHVVLTLSRGQLRLTDPRRFGLFRVGRVEREFVEVAALGPDPFAPGAAPALALACRGTRRAIKEVLLDQRVLAGVGNIYACEALHVAGIDPRRRAHRLAPDRVARLADAVVAVLADAIAQGGTTMRDFVGGDGAPGGYGERLRVYDRAGEPCRCGAPIRAVRQGARGTFFCPGCQR